MAFDQVADNSITNLDVGFAYHSSPSLARDNHNNTENENNNNENNEDNEDNESSNSSNSTAIRLFAMGRRMNHIPPSSDEEKSQSRLLFSQSLANRQSSSVSSDNDHSQGSDNNSQESDNNSQESHYNSQRSDNNTELMGSSLNNSNSLNSINEDDDLSIALDLSYVNMNRRRRTPRRRPRPPDNASRTAPINYRRNSLDGTATRRRTIEDIK